VDPQRVREFLRVHHHAVLATIRKDGRPQLSPVTAGVDDEGRVLVSTRETAMKAKNLARDPRASLCLLNDGFFGEWVQAEGTAEAEDIADQVRKVIAIGSQLIEGRNSGVHQL